MRSYYDTLSVPENATTDDIKRAYRAIAFRYHPDRNQGDSTAEETFRNASEAYSVLSDPEKRRQYDTDRSGYTRNESFSYEEAAYQFMRMMYAYAAEMTMRNVNYKDVAQFLVSKGCPSGVATTIAVSIETERKQMIRKQARSLLLKACLSFLGGLLFTGVSYGMGGTKYFIFWGLMVYGIWNGAKALYYLVTGRVPGGRNQDAT
ncbi:MAG: J domain-containing protein [Candidatus Competibacteraceae bacterium]|nr:J domain-containing protein [Candidatus Competibacteraceae bacterium]